MNKEKAKNIALGVSLILNLLGSLLIGGSLIHACNSPASPEEADLSPVTLAGGKLSVPNNAMASSAASRYWLFNETLDISGSHRYDGFFTVDSTGERFYSILAMYRSLVYVPDVSSSSTSSSVGSSLSAYIGAGSGWQGDYRRITFDEAPTGELLSFMEAHASPVAEEPYSVIKVPHNFWGYRLLNGSYDANTGGMITAAEISGIWSGGVRLGGVPFTLGENTTKYDAIEFYYWNFYGRSFMNEKGEIVNATSDGFKNVFYLDHVSVLPQGLDASNGSNWVLIGSVVYGMQDSGSLYTDAHRFNWLDESYKTFKVEGNSALFVHNYALTGSMTDAMINPTLRNMNRSEAMRLALTGTSADVSGGVTIGGDGSSDVFSLIGSAFSSLVPILSVQILPYLTLGTLLLVPLIVLVIFAILKVLNK